MHSGVGVNIAAWNLRRVRQIESALHQGVDPLSALEDEALQKKLDRLHRNHTRLERSYHRNMNALKALQTERHNRPVMDPPYPETVSPLVDSIQISKRTQTRQAKYREQFRKLEPFHNGEYFPAPRPRPIFQNEPNPAPRSSQEPQP